MTDAVLEKRISYSGFFSVAPQINQREKKRKKTLGSPACAHINGPFALSL